MEQQTDKQLEIRISGLERWADTIGAQLKSLRAELCRRRSHIKVGDFVEWGTDLRIRRGVVEKVEANEEGFRYEVRLKTSTGKPGKLYAAYSHGFSPPRIIEPGTPELPL